MRAFCESKMNMTEITKTLPMKECVTTIVGDYTQNLDLPHTSEDQTGKICYLSPVNLHVFGLVDVSLDQGKMKSHVYEESKGKKGGINIVSCVVAYLKTLMEILTPTSTNLSQTENHNG